MDSAAEMNLVDQQVVSSHHTPHREGLRREILMEKCPFTCPFLFFPPLSFIRAYPGSCFHIIIHASHTVYSPFPSLTYLTASWHEATSEAINSQFAT
jgi:hypothetical protein